MKPRVIYVDISESEARQRLYSNRTTQHRHDVRDDNFALVVIHFEPPVPEEQVIYFRKSEPFDEWVARELVQESILQAYLSLHHLKDASRFKSWLYGITLNICRRYHEHRLLVLRQAIWAAPGETEDRENCPGITD